MQSRERRKRTLEEAWIGDAVLSLFARRYILLAGEGVSAEAFERMTSNRFLSALGDPSEVEAEIGRRYTASGLDAAFTWIEERLMPLFQRQEENRRRATGVQRPA